MSSAGITGFDPSILMNYFNARLTTSATAPQSSSSSSSSGNAIVSSATPWDS